MINDFVYFIKGYIEITAEGYYIEHFLNSCLNNNILIWGITRQKGTILKFKIRKKDLEKVNTYASKNSCIIDVGNKKGLPFLIEKYKKRKILIVLSLFVSLSIIATPQFVWNIEIDGCNNIKEQEILTFLKENGLKIGKLKRRINLNSIINKMRLERSDISWVGIEFKGTNAIVKIVESSSQPEVIDENDYCNVVAKKNGIITSIIAENGTAVVKKDDEVKKGDILIAGYMQGSYTDKYYVNGRGVVKAKIFYEQTEKIDIKEIKREQTGKENKKFSLKINNFKINFYKRVSNFKIYDTIVTNKKMKLFSNIYLPFEIITYDTYELTEKTILNDYDMARKKGEELAKSKLNEKIDGEIINSETLVNEKDSYFEITVKYEVVEEIGTKEKIEF